MVASLKEFTITLSDLPDFGSPRPYVLTELIMEKLGNNLSRFRSTVLRFNDANVFDVVLTHCLERLKSLLKHEGIKIEVSINRDEKTLSIRKQFFTL